MSEMQRWLAVGIGVLFVAGLFWWFVVRIPEVADLDARVALLERSGEEGVPPMAPFERKFNHLTSAKNVLVYRLVDDDGRHRDAPFDPYDSDRRQLAPVTPSQSWRKRFLALLGDKRANNGTPTCACDPYGDLRLDFTTPKGKVSLYVHLAGDEFLWLDKELPYPVRWLNFSPARPQYVKLIKELFPSDKEMQELDPLDRHDRDSVPY